MTKVQSFTRENEASHWETRVDYLDDQSRRNNLRFVGVPEEPNDNWVQCR